MKVEFPERFRMSDYFLYHNLEEGREGKVCLYYNDETFTYADAARASNRAGGALRESGLSVEDRVLIAGLSNEEFASTLRAILFPFKNVPNGTSIEIYHGSHGRFETRAPVRTFVPYTIAGKEYVLAAYTCTPIVKIPVSQLTPGAKVKGEEIADLGAGNQPIDMVPYMKDGHNFILIANSAFGVLKLKADNLETYPAIEAPTRTDVAGVPFDKIAALTNVKHLAQFDNSNVLVLTAKATPGVNLSTVALP